VPAGAVAWHCVVLAQVTLVAGLAPKLTAVVPGSNPIPFNVTTVPPASGPDVGSIDVSSATYVYVAEPLANWPLTVAVTPTLPAPAGVVASHCWLLAQETLVAGTPPK